jgi:hypothetical protein
MSYSKSLVLAAALLTAGAASSAILPEGSYPEPAVRGEGQSRAEVAAEATSRNQPAKLDLVPGEGRPQFVRGFGQQALSRSEVIADRELWQRVGLGAAAYGEATPDLHGHDYQARLAEYQELRNGPVFAERVRRLASGTDVRAKII